MVVTNPSVAELIEIERMSNTIFLDNREAESMKRRFPDLYNKKNRSHILIMKENKEIVAVLNWYMAHIKCEESILTFGCIGGVCTKPEYRGRGYGDILVKEAYRSMEEAGVSVCLISGDRGLYLRNKAYKLGMEYECRFQEAEKCDRVVHTNKDLGKCADKISYIYNCEDIRFIRSHEHTVSILGGIESVHHRAKAEIYNTKEAYVVIENCPDDESVLRILEYCGPEKEVYEIIKNIIFERKVKLYGNIALRDGFLLSKAYEKKAKNYNGTIRIIDSKRLFSQLKYRFLRFGIKNAKCIRQDDEYIIDFESKMKTVSDEELHKMIFGDIGDEYKNELFPIDIPIVSGIDSV